MIFVNSPKGIKNTKQFLSSTKKKEILEILQKSKHTPQFSVMKSKTKKQKFIQKSFERQFRLWLGRRQKKDSESEFYQFWQLGGEDHEESGNDDGRRLVGIDLEGSEEVEQLLGLFFSN
jgi:hypothetical protein